MHVDHSYIIDTQSHSHSKYSNITTPIKEKTTTTINPIKATSMTIDKTNKSPSMTIDEPMILSDNDTISEDNDSQKIHLILQQISIGMKKLHKHTRPIQIYLSKKLMTSVTPHPSMNKLKSLNIAMK
jgi:hypothetical protein